MLGMRALEIFISVVENGGFSAASREIGLSQPAVSMQVKRLEDELGVILLKRRSTGIELTPSGRLLYTQGQAVINEWKHLLERVRQKGQQERDTLRVGSSTVPVEAVLPSILRRFQKRCPHVMVQIDISDSQQVVDDLAAGRIDVGLVGARFNGSKLEWTMLCPDRLVLIVPPDHRLLVSDQPVSFDSLKHESFLVREEGSGTKRCMELFLREHGVDPAELDVSAGATSTEGIVAAVAAGAGISMISERLARRAAQSGRICMVSLPAPPPERMLYAVRRPGHQPLVDTFIGSATDWGEPRA